MVFAAREAGFDAHGLREIPLRPLPREEAVRLLERYALPLGTRDQVIADSDGNPLALMEFGATGRTHAGGSVRLPATERVRTAFNAQISALPEQTRLILLVAAAEGRGELADVLAAAATLGAGVDDLQEAERVGLLRVSGSGVDFRHPLVKSAAYQGAVLADRIRVHRALASITADADARARHRASAAVGPDRDVAEELERAAVRAATRGGPAIAADLYRQAAQLSPSAPDRVRRLVSAAGAAVTAGDLDRAAELARSLSGEPETPAALAPALAILEFERGEQRQAAHILIEHAERAAADEAEAMLRTAATYAWFSGDPDAIKAAAAGIPQDETVCALAHLAECDYANGLPLLVSQVERSQGMPAVYAAAFVGADTTMLRLATAEAARRRREGLVGALPEILQMLARVQVLAGRHTDARSSVAEAKTIARDTGQVQRTNRLNLVLARIAAIEGDADRCAELTAGRVVDSGVSAACLLALPDLGAGRYEQALERLEGAWLGPGRYMTALVAAAGDQVEAAYRLGAPERAAEPLHRLVGFAAAGGRPWAEAIVLRCRALLEDSEEHFVEAVRLHQDGERPFERARTELLYGEWLRRNRRRGEAGRLLRAAMGTFDDLQAAPWADRARTELHVAGENPTPARPFPARSAERLTAQELQVVRLAAEGHSSREIAAQLFLSRRTVEYHLYKAYPKLGVKSRVELGRLDLE